MKKYTNKILLVVFITFVFVEVISITIDFQIKRKKNPELFNSPTNYFEEEVGTCSNEADTLTLTDKNIEESIEQ